MFGIDDAIIGGGLGLVGSLIGGIGASKAAKKAAELQAQGAQAASDKVGLAISQANQPIAEATQNAQTLATAGGQGVLNAATTAGQQVTGAAREANQILDPYSTAGRTAADYLNGAVGAGGDFNKKVTLADLQIDPGFAFRQQQGELALSRSAAAKGGAMSGGALKDLANYSQGLASQEYQNAFNRYQTDTQSRYDRLFGTSQMGMAAGTQQGNNLTSAAKYQGDTNTDAAKTMLSANEYAGSAGLQGAGMLSENTMGGAKAQADLLTQKANAQASGVVGSANSLYGGISNGLNAAGNGIALSSMLKNPSVGKVGANTAKINNASGFFG